MYKSEMEKLYHYLKISRIPFEVVDLYGTMQICYPSKESCICDAVCHQLSYGYKEGLLEIMGLCENDVEGYLTAEEVYKRIKRNWEER